MARSKALAVRRNQLVARALKRNLKYNPYARMAFRAYGMARSKRAKTAYSLARKAAPTIQKVIQQLKQEFQTLNNVSPVDESNYFGNENERAYEKNTLYWARIGQFITDEGTYSRDAASISLSGIQVHYCLRNRDDDAKLYCRLVIVQDKYNNMLNEAVSKNFFSSSNDREKSVDFNDINPKCMLTMRSINSKKYKILRSRRFTLGGQNINQPVTRRSTLGKIYKKFKKPLKITYREVRRPGATPGTEINEIVPLPNIRVMFYYTTDISGTQDTPLGSFRIKAFYRT